MRLLRYINPVYSAGVITSILVLICVSVRATVDITEKRPNILICIADDQSFPHTSFYGTRWVNTPAFDRVAREGIAFMNAYTPNAKCAPSRSSILTGRNPWQLGAAGNHSPFFPAEYRTYAEALEAHGYRIGYTGKGWAPGDAGEVDGRKRQLLGEAYNRQRTTPPTPSISDIDYAANFQEFLQEANGNEPFCFWVGGLEPHRPYSFGTGVGIGGKDPMDIDSVFGFWPDVDSVRQDMLDYAFEIEYFDAQLAAILDVLEANGELDNTLIIVTADNGMPFPRVKGQAYELSNHLPLAMMWKKGIHDVGRRYHPYVSFTDLAPTLLEVAGVRTESAGMAAFEGSSLVPVLQNREDPHAREYMVIGRERNDIGRPHDWGYPIRGIIREGLLYLRNYEAGRWPSGNPETGYLDTDGSPTKSVILNDRRNRGTSLYWDVSFGKKVGEELYDLRHDRDCLANRAADPLYNQQLQELAALLRGELKAEEDPRALGRGEVFDQYPYSNERVRDFYSRFMAGERPKTGWVNDTDFESITEKPDDEVH